MSDEQAAEMERLRARLAEAEQLIAALRSGQIDPVTAGSTPLLLPAAHNELRQREQLFRAVFDGALDALLLADDHGVYVDANPAACAMFGLARDELVGRRIAEFAVEGYDTGANWQAFQRAGTLTGEFTLVRPDGQRRSVEFSASSSILPGLHLSALRDVGEQRRSRASYEAMIERGHDVVGRMDEHGILRFISRAVESVLGFRPRDMVGKDRRDFVDERDWIQLAVMHDQLLARGLGASTTAELRLLTKDGTPRWVEWTSSNCIDDPDVAAIVLNFRDITERRQASDELRASEERYRRIIESTSEGVWTAAPDGRTTFINRRMANMLGYDDPAVLIDQPPELFADPASLEQLGQRLRRRGEGASDSCDLRFKKKDGSPLWARLNANPLVDFDGTFLGSLALVTDISASRQGDEMRARLAAVVESSVDAIISTDLAGVVTSWNPAAERLYGYAAAEMLGQPLDVIVPPDRREELRQLLQRLEQGQAIGGHETVRIRKDGTPVDVALAVSLVKDSEGAVIGVSKIARDLTERRRIEERLRQAQKMDAIGNLAGGVAHDFNNVLTVVLGTAHVLQRELTGEHLEDVRVIIDACGRAVGLTRQLLAFSRRQVLQPRTIDLNHVVGGIAPMLQRLVGENIELVLDLPPALGAVCADSGQLEQVIMNLVVNARDAMRDGGVITIETSNVDVDDDEDAAGTRPGLPAGRHVQLAVSDSGAGMDEATLKRIFEPFFTTKEPGQGTGLGLSTVFGIVAQSGGQVFVDSTPGRGSRFRVVLPRDPTATATATIIKPLVSDLQRGTETVLVVEDDDQVRRLVALVLRRQGYAVLEAGNGGEALLIGEQTAHIDLLLSDVVMPRLDGRRVSERLQPLHPRMKVLFMSGYTDDAVLRHGISQADVHFLPKPITPQDLTDKVRDVLDALR